MKKIINWTLGGFFRAFGRTLAFLAIGAFCYYLMSLNGFKITDLLLFDYVKADTISHSSDQYNVYVFYQTGADTCLSGIGQGYKNLDTSSNLTEYVDYYNNAVSRVDYLTNVNLINGTQYSFDVILSFNPKSNITSYNGWSYSIEGSTTTNNSGLSADNISSYNCYITNVTNNNYQVKLHCDFIPKYTLQKLYVRVNTGCTAKSISYFNTYTMLINSIGSTENSINQQTNDLINNQNQNTQEIIDNQNQNTQDIINAGNQNAQQIIDSNKVCTFYDKNSIIKSDTQININGNEEYAQGFGVTDFIKIDSSSSLDVIESFSSQKYVCFYNVNKVKISCIQLNSFSGIIDIPSTASYIRSTIYISANKPTFKICTNGNQAIQDTLEDDDTSQATNEASDFFSSFSTNTHGLTGIITAPLNAIESLTSKTCSPLVVPLPYVNENLTLPCMREIYVNNFGGFMTLYDVITLGIVSYWIMVRIFALVKDFKNPDHDEIEVMDL